jgi:AraC family transcriptional regulator of adaptative response/methylated-DNA-[protein]-cysteine methyltransferase
MSSESDYKTVERSIRYLEENFRRQPSLEELSSHAGMSAFHFQKVFTRWAGVSPKRFLQFLTLEHAKGLLRESEPVLATSFASGLSGPARLHDLFVTAEGVTPGEYKKGGSPLELSYGFQETPFGLGLFGHTPRGLCHLSFLPSGSKAHREGALADLSAEWPGADLSESAEVAAGLAETIFAPQAASSTTAPLALFLKGTNYQIKVWNALLRIPRGAVTTYGRLATFMGTPGAARAIGSAVARNHIAYLIPCHRVIREMGAFGEYRWGPERKRAMLGWEAARQAM